MAPMFRRSSSLPLVMMMMMMMKRRSSRTTTATTTTLSRLLLRQRKFGSSCSSVSPRYNGRAWISTTATTPTKTAVPSAATLARARATTRAATTLLSSSPSSPLSSSLSSIPSRHHHHRTLTTDATVASPIPDSEDERFEIHLPQDSLKAYNMDDPAPIVYSTKKELKQMYYDMIMIRRMELAADSLYKEKKIRGFCHLSTGQEAVAVGIEHAIAKTDSLITAYRCHGFSVMRGGSVRSVIGELLGRREGIAHGKGGSMHMFRPNFFGGNGIVGAQVPVGAGIAFAHQYMNQPNITLALYGDGASNQGQVFEAYNMAHLWKLPVIFACENNKYGMGTSAERSSALTEYYKRGQYISGLRIEGMDVLAVKAAVQLGKKHLLDGNGPLVYEFVTYRYGGHSMSDPGTTYRTREEIQRMRSTNDPIAGFKSLLIKWGIADESELKTINQQARAHVDAEVSAAEHMAFPEPSRKTLFEDVYVAGSEPTFLRGRIPEEDYYY